MSLIRFEFANGEIYSFSSDEEGLRSGQWSYPYPNTPEDSVVFGMIEAYSQAPDSPVASLLFAHGEPSKVTIIDVDTDSEEYIYYFEWNVGYRSGKVCGTFAASKKDIDLALGHTAYFGEILGKHSEVYGTLHPEHFKIVSSDPFLVHQFKSQNLVLGYHPLAYIFDPETEEALFPEVEEQHRY